MLEVSKCYGKGLGDAVVILNRLSARLIEKVAFEQRLEKGNEVNLTMWVSRRRTF